MSRVQLQRRDRFERGVCAHGTKAAGRQKESEDNQKKQTETEC